MAVTPYEEKKYAPSAAVAQAQQALAQQQANKPGQYQSQFQSGLNDLMGQIQARPGFQYDVNADALYQQAAQNYMQQGQQAMMDTMGQAAAMTGGYGNSYAQTAGQQQYNQHLLGLTEMIPQFQQMAMQQYQMEGNDLLNQYNLMLQQEESAYNRWMDNVNRYYADLDRLQAAYDNERSYDYSRFTDDRDFAYGQYRDQQEDQYRADRDAVADDQWNRQWQYQQDRDQVADSQWNQQWQHQLERDQVADTQWNQQWQHQLERDQVADSQWNQQWQYQQQRDQIADNQWNQQWAYQQERDRVADEQWQREYEEMVRQYNEEMAWQQAQAASRSSGGGGGGRISGNSQTNYQKTEAVLATGGYNSAEMLQIIRDPDNGLSKSEQDALVTQYQKPAQKQEVANASNKRNNDTSAYWGSR